MIISSIMKPSRSFVISKGSRQFLDTIFRRDSLERDELIAGIGGEGGHVPEEFNIDGPGTTGTYDNIRVTRCYTVAAAMTAYFCGGDVLVASDNGTLPYYAEADGGISGLESFLKYAAMERTTDIIRVGIGGRSG